MWLLAPGSGDALQTQGCPLLPRDRSLARRLLPLPSGGHDAPFLSHKPCTGARGHIQLSSVLHPALQHGRRVNKCSETRLRRTWAGERGPFVDGSSGSYSQTHRTSFSPTIRKQKSLKKQKAKESKEKHVAFLLHLGPKASES